MMVAEYERACELWPGWPSDPIHAAAIVAEESGELVQAALDMTYGTKTPGTPSERALEEAVHTGAMALRFIVELHNARPVETKVIR